MKNKVNWPMTIFLVGYQVLLLLALPVYLYYQTPSWSLILVSVVLLHLTGMSITVGYHRAYSHCAHKPGPVLEFLLLFFGTMAAQGSVLQWCHDHRKHHKYTDTERDPHSIEEGFFHAHMGWLLYKDDEPIDERKLPHLARNSWVQFQHRYYLPLVIFTNALATVVVAWICNDFLGACMISLWTRVFLLHHFTWFINSLAHTVGARTYAREISAVDNFLVSLVTFGEGYHNYHHAFPSDYRNGVRWFNYDPSKWSIWLFDKLGMTTDKQAINLYATQGKIIREDEKLFKQILDASSSPRIEYYRKLVDTLSEKISTTVNDIQSTLATKRKASAASKKEFKKRLRELRAELRDDWQSWLILSRQIIRLS